MDTFTIVLLVVAILLAVSCLILAITKWKSWTDSEKSVIASQLMALAKTVQDALKDGKLEAAELRVILNQLVALISVIVKTDTETIKATLQDKETEYQIESTADY